MMKSCFLKATAITAFAMVMSARGEFDYSEKQDELTNKTRRSLTVLADDRRSTVELRYDEADKSLMVFLNPKDTIFPDIVGDGLTMGATLTLRSSLMPEPKEIPTRMNTMEYDFCYFKVKASGAKKLFGGDSLTVQFNRTAKRYTFPMGGDGYAEALDKTVATAVEAEAEAAEQAKASKESGEKAAAETAEVRARFEKGLADKKRVEQEASEKEMADAQNRRAAEVAEQDQEAAEAKAASSPQSRGKKAGEAFVADVGESLEKHDRAAVAIRARSEAKKAGFSGPGMAAFVKAFDEAVQAAR